MKEVQKNILRKVDVTKEYKCVGRLQGSGLMGNIVKVKSLKDGPMKGQILICKMVKKRD